MSDKGENRMKLSVIVPAYNEEKIIGDVLDGLKKVLGEGGHDAEIIVVDDGSIDGTSRLAQSKGVRVVRHEKNYGYGAALKTGIRAAGSGHILIVDGDGSYPLDDIPELLRDCDKYDMVIGARTKTGAAMSLMRNIAKSFLGKLAEYLVKERIPDINSGLRVFTKSMYEEYKRILPDGFSFTMTITLASMSARKNVRFVPIGYRKRKGISKIRPIHDTLGFFLLIIRTILLFNPLRVFMPVAALFFIAAAGLAVYSINVVGRFMDVSVTLLFVFGAQIIILGFIADLINRRVD